MHAIAKLCVLLLRLLLPAPGRHRGPVAAPRAARHPHVPAQRVPVRPSPVLLWSEPLVPLVRPYVHVLTAEERRPWRGRRTLWLAARGIDIGACLPRGMEVTA
ncbi:hypothetical protein [Streptomyces sp. NPDC059080]|uniref:hypothetical protein n=1 Tax=Streptomyces sp. NPDC059080 TaxID=3346718 RepID=UPI0036C9547D